MGKAKIKDNSIKYIRSLCDERLREYFPAGIPDFVLREYEDDLRFVEKSGSVDLMRIYYEFSETAKRNCSYCFTRGGHNSIVHFLLGNIPIDPLPAYRYCPKCGHFELIYETRFGIDAPDKKCPKCGTRLAARGYALHGMLEWGICASASKMTSDAFECAANTRVLLFAKLKELYSDNQVVRWLSEPEQDSGKREEIGFWILPDGKDFERDFPEFVVYDENGEVAASADMWEVRQADVTDIYLTDNTLLNTMWNAKNKQETYIGKEMTVSDIIDTKLLTTDEERKIRKTTDISWFALSESIAAGHDTFSREYDHILDDVQSFFTRETMYENLIAMGLPKKDAFEVVSFVRKGKASASAPFMVEEWRAMIVKRSLPQDFVLTSQTQTPSSRSRRVRSGC